MTIFLFITLLVLLIVVHELGHFVAAKRARILVEEFGFGFPPRMLGWKRGETVYSLNWLPLGGFVKIFGEEGQEPGHPRSFAAQSVGWRAVIVAAGVAMNVILAMALLSLGNSLGLPTLLAEEVPAGARDVAVRILDVRANSPAETSGLRLGDAILEVRNISESIGIFAVAPFQEAMKKYGDSEVTVVIQRGSETLEFPLVPRAKPPEGEGPIGVVLGKVGIVAYPWYEALWRGGRDTFLLTWETIRQLGIILKTLLAEGKLVGELAGPVGIVFIGSSLFGLGASYVIQFAALLSINLAIINLLPIPALDGGRLLFLGVEKLRGAPVKRETEAFVHRLGFAFLLALIVLVTLRDIGRFF